MSAATCRRWRNLRQILTACFRLNNGAPQEKIRSQYSPDDEAKMIDAVIKGMSVEEVAKLTAETDIEEGDDRVVELF